MTGAWQYEGGGALQSNHGLVRLDNRLDAYPRAIEFLDDVLGRDAPSDLS